MDPKPRKQDQRGVGVSLGTVIGGFVKGIGGLLGLAAKLEQEGESEYKEQGEIAGRTKSGKAYRGAYGFRVKVGLHTENQKSKAQMSNSRRARAARLLEYYCIHRACPVRKLVGRTVFGISVFQGEPLLSWNKILFSHGACRDASSLS